MGDFDWRSPVARERQDGEGGIRTPGALRHTRFPSVSTRPLCDLSMIILKFYG